MECVQTFVLSKYLNAIEDITEALNNACVPFVPLKGAVIRDLYPDPSMRSSCDIDILVHEEDLDKAIEAIKDNTDLEYKDRNYHDVLLANDIVSLELHFSIKENMEKIDRLLKEAWNPLYQKVKDIITNSNRNTLCFMFSLI